MKPKINPDYCYYKLRLVKSPVHGWGVVAAETIPKGRFVIEYTGEVMNRKRHKEVSAKRKRCYIYTLDKYWSLDGLVGGSGAERVNHSCDPNLRADIRGHRVFFVSRRKIKKGEELSVDYYYHWDLKDLSLCMCKAKNCRGTINFPPHGIRNTPAYLALRERLESQRKRVEKRAIL